MPRCRYRLRKFEWDEVKRRKNLRKDGIDFVGCEHIFLGNTLTTQDVRHEYSETRFITIGLLEGRVVTAVHTETDDLIRMISIRKATRDEQKSYFKHFAN